MTSRRMQIGNTNVGDGHPCYVIAEIGSNHQGDTKLCADMIRAAAGAGASAVKLQKRHLDTLFTTSYGAAPYTGPHAFGPTYLEHRRRLELDEAAWRELAVVARDAQVDLIATAFDEPSGEFLAELGVAAIKIASGDATNLPLVQWLADLKVPLIASTGGLNWSDTDLLVEALRSAHAAAILQCTSIYPCPAERLDLAVIADMRRRYPGVVVGYSGHEIGVGPSVGAVALGAAIIERHFTIDRTLRGSDQQMSLSPDELATLVHQAEETRQALGTVHKECHPDERPALVKLGKKLVAARALNAGSQLGADDLAVRSPGDGLSPAHLPDLVGRCLLRDIGVEEDVTLTDLEPLTATERPRRTAKPSFRCDQRLAVVTGAAGTLGPVWASTLADAGATTIAIAQPGTEHRPEVERLESSGVAILVADTTTDDAIHDVAETVSQRWGPPHILVASAGLDSTPHDGQTLDLGALRLDDIAPVMHTNAIGTALTISAFGGHMVTAGRGSIILIGSQYALVAPRPAVYSDAGLRFTKNPAYGASKAAVVQLARYFAAHWGESGVRVNALCPGGIEGAQTDGFKQRFASELPLGRLLRPDELQGALLFLASDASIAVTGSQLLVDGGYTCW